MNQIDNDGTLRDAFRASWQSLIDLLGLQLLQSTCTGTECRRSTAAVVPSHLVRQLGVALVEFVQWRIDSNRHSALTRSLVCRL